MFDLKPQEVVGFRPLLVVSNQTLCSENLLCRYRKRTDIYYSTSWSFENVAKNCQFQFLDLPPPPKILLPVSELPVTVLRPPPPNCQFQFLDPPKYCCQFQNCHFQFLDLPQNIVASFSF